jgi:two-component system sensor histidine kinase KdpD
LRPRLAGAEVLLYGDRRRVGQALINLIYNAARFGDPGSTVELHISRTGDAVRLAVLDDGPGMRPGVRPDIVARVTGLTGANAVEGDVPGTPATGLGLRVARAIVEAHGGAMGAETRPGGGAIFWIELPNRR